MNLEKPDSGENGFEIGDIVYLKSGSPQLTIIDVVDDIISVMWVFDGVPQEFTADYRCFYNGSN